MCRVITLLLKQKAGPSKKWGKHAKIALTTEFKQDLNWFLEFVPKFKGTAFFVHSNFHQEIELDACLQGLGARCGNQVSAI